MDEIKKIGLLGEKLGHSYSKLIHEMISDNPYEFYEVPKEEFDDFMIRKEFDAINVTIPYKEKVLPYLDYISEKAKKIGSVNTIVNRDGKLYGYNTDYDGFKYLVLKNNFDIKDSKCLVLGSGGTSKTVCEVLKDLNAKEVFVATRKKTDELNYVNYEDVNYDEFDFIINTTPVGMYPNIGESLINCKLKHVKGIIDVIYNPLRTKCHFLNEDVKYQSGLEMLIYQAIKSHKIFFGEDSEIDDETILSIEATIKPSMLNIVLIGMPGSGKTTIAKKIEQTLDFKVVDTDELIEKRFGYKVNEIFSLFGEEKFREYESMIIKEVAIMKRTVIATGGGVILNKDNMDLLRANGIVIYIKRDLEEIINDFDYSRPLAKNVEELKEIYEERKEIYERYADISFSSETLLEIVDFVASLGEGEENDNYPKV